MSKQAVLKKKIEEILVEHGIFRRSCVPKLLSLILKRAKVWVGEDIDKIAWELEFDGSKEFLEGYNERAKDILERIEEDTK